MILLLRFGAFTCLLVVMVVSLPLEDAQGNDGKNQLTQNKSTMTTTNGIQITNQQTTHDEEIKFPTNIPTQHISSIMEPRYSLPSKRQGRSKQNYFIIAIAPIEKHDKSSISYNMIPIERAIDNEKGEGDENEDEKEPVLTEDLSQATEDERLITMHKFNKYFRRLMRRIRKGTRKLMHQTFFRSTESRQNHITPTSKHNVFNGFYLKEGLALKPILA